MPKLSARSRRKSPVVLATIARRILFIRGHRVMLDRDLAGMYGVPTKALNQAVQRNLRRFPVDFAFQLKPGEAESLRSQSVTSNARGGRRYLPWVFTEQGVAMLSSVLNSRRAVTVNIAIMRAFVRLREVLRIGFVMPANDATPVRSRKGVRRPLTRPPTSSRG